jgi:predicted transcriptional regulator
MSESRKIIRVRDVMTKDVDVVEGVMTVADALRAMKHATSKALIVAKRHADDEYGIVLLSDIARQVLARDRAPERVNLYEIMSKPVVWVPPEMDVRYCSRLFHKFGLTLAPVLDAGTVVGVVSYDDIVLRGLAREVLGS